MCIPTHGRNPFTSFLRCYGGDGLEKEEKLGNSEGQLDHPEIPWGCKL